MGQAGEGTGIDTNVPIQVAGAISFSSISAGGQHSCGLDTSGYSYCWGDNSEDQLGQSGKGAPSHELAPAAIETAITFSSISAGHTHTCGVQSDGAAYCWGQSDSGEIGDGGDKGKSAPTNISGVYQKVRAFTNATCGITTNGSTSCWGANDFGQIGDGTTTMQATADTSFVSGSHIFRDISGWGGTRYGITEYNQIFVWGKNLYNSYLDGETNTNSSTPISLGNSTQYQSIHRGTDFTCALGIDGEIYCWGLNDFGQLGNGTTDTDTSASSPVPSP